MPDLIDLSQIDLTPPSDLRDTDGGGTRTPDLTPGNPTPQQTPPPKEEKKEEKKEEEKKEEETSESTETEKEETGEEAEREETSQEPPSLIETIIDRFGFDFGEEEFEETEEGLIALAVRGAEKRFEQLVENMKEEKPQAYSFFQYLQNGGDPQEYINVMSPEVNWLKVGEIKEDDGSLQERVIKEFLREAGEEEASISEALEEYKAAGILHSEAKRALARLQKMQKEEQEGLLARQQEAREEQERAAEAFFSRLEEKVTKSPDINGLPITEKEKPDFIRFIRPGDNGRSPYAELVEKGLTDEALLTIQYLAFKNFDFSKLVEIKAKTNRAQTLREKLKSGSTGSGNGLHGSPHEKQSRGGSQVDISKLDLSLPGSV